MWTILQQCFCFVFGDFLALMWALSCPTRDPTCTPCTGGEVSTTDHQGILWISFSNKKSQDFGEMAHLNWVVVNIDIIGP